MKKLWAMVCLAVCVLFAVAGCLRVYVWYCLKRADLPAYTREDMEAKLARLGRARVCEPDNAQVYAAIGRAYEEIRQRPFLGRGVSGMPPRESDVQEACLTWAMDAYQQAVERDPNNALYRHRLGRACLEVPPRKDESARERAAAELAKAVELDRNNPLHHYWMGVYYQLSGSLPGAITKYREAIARDRHYIERVLKTAWEIDRYPRCLQDIARGHEEMECMLPRFFMEQREFAAARAACIAACQRGDTFSLDNATELLSRLLQLGEPALAKLYALEWLEQRPVAPLMLMVVSALQLGGERDLALKKMEQVTDLNSSSAMCHARLADLYGNAGRTDDAVKEYEAAIRIEPKNADRYESLAQFWCRRKNYAAAARAYGRMAEAFPDKGYPLYQIGNMRMKMKDYDGAIEAFRDATDLAPDDNRFGRALSAACGVKAAAEKSGKAPEETPASTPNQPSTVNH